MPVIRTTATSFSPTGEERTGLVDQLVRELTGVTGSGEPLIFEISLDQMDRIDVLVIWSLWERIRSEVRSNIIVEAYQSAGRAGDIAQAMGVTPPEALEQQILPYAVVPMAHPGEISSDVLRKAMLKEGALQMPNGTVELRLPTMTLAEQAHRRLVNELPKGYWSIVQQVGSIP